MGTTIKIRCIDQTLTYEGTPVVASGGVNEDYVEFTFCSLWYGFSKVVVFYQNKGEIYYSLVSADNKAVVPKEVTATKGTMYLGVMGVSGDVTRTSQVLQYRIENGALDGFTPEEPSPEIYQQVLAKLQEIKDEVYKKTIPDWNTVALHRIPRGKDITSYYNDGTLWTRIANNFDDIYVGDYFKMSRPISAYEQTGAYQTTGSQYVTISELNPEYYNGDTRMLDKNHIELIPGQFKSGSFHFGKSRMNSTNTTEGGYAGSEMFTKTLGAVATSGSTAATATINQQLYAEFGTHLQTFRTILTSSINATGYNRFGTNSGCTNSCGWHDVQSVLLSEMDVYGGVIWSSSGMDSGTSKTQKSLFRYCPECVNNRSSYYWLKDIVSAAAFALVNRSGFAGDGGAGIANCDVRPRFILA